MQRITNLKVFYHGRIVGTMALYKNFIAAFEYDKGWLAEGFSISPYSLPLRQQVFIPKADVFDGLFGVFADSLPDGWGRLLVDRLLLKRRLNPAALTQMDRLGIVGASGMGALTYQPEIILEDKSPVVDFDKIAQECSKMLATEYSDDLDNLFKLGGSSGGARPKILTNIEGEEWIIKFPAKEDNKNIGRQEYEYSQCAKKCGINMAETKLFSSSSCAGYFGTKRFDRVKKSNGSIERVHMVSVAGLLETSHRIPNLDYDILMKLTLNLTRNFSEVEKLFRLMCFNVFAHNRDDHSKNFSFLYNEAEKRWMLAPAYDLTYSNSIGGEHATTVHGNGQNPGMKEVLAVAKDIGINSIRAREIAETVYECIKTDLKKYI